MTYAESPGKHCQQYIARCTVCSQTHRTDCSIQHGQLERHSQLLSREDESVGKTHLQEVLHSPTGVSGLQHVRFVVLTSIAVMPRDQMSAVSA